jgi:hypothetical protein
MDARDSALYGPVTRDEAGREVKIRLPPTEREFGRLEPGSDPRSAVSDDSPSEAASTR